MLEPTASPRPSAVVLAASGLILALAACDGREPAPAPSLEPAPAAPAVITAPRQIDRAELLAAVDAAASAYAAGQSAASQSPASPDTLVGRRFVVRQAFACSPADLQPPETETSEAGTDQNKGRALAALAPDRKTLQLSLSPADLTESPLILDGGQTWESVEGFWLQRPWIRTDDCPALPTPVEGETPSPAVNTGATETPAPSVGLAAVFETHGSRLSRRNGRAYAFTVRGAGDLPVILPPGGYRLVLEGRAIAFANGRAIRCASQSPNQRPICLVAAQVDRVAFEDATGRTLSEWRSN